MADPAQGETGGKPKVKSHSRVKDKVKNLKNRLPGMRKHAGGEDEVHDDSSEHDDGSPRVSGCQTSSLVTLVEFTHL
jgi:hypothetical protein